VVLFRLHMGLNYIDPKAYRGWNGELFGCQADAENLNRYMEELGWPPAAVWRDGECTTERLRNWFTSAAAEAKRGDRVFVSYSGHGSQVKDRNGDEPDKLDETLCMWNKQLTDDQIRFLLTRFRPGVRVMMFIDACHSQSVTRARGPISATKELAIDERANCKQSIVTWAAAMDAQTAGDLEAGGVFTTNVLKAARQNPQASYAEVHEQVLRALGHQGSGLNDKRQRPCLEQDGPPVPGWLLEPAFSPGRLS
jgi:hypothetical protein